MKNILKLEELGMLALGIFLFELLDFDWWVFPALFLLPDIGLLGYLFGNRIGALVYNLFHHKGLALLVYVLGGYMGNEWLMLAGVILFSHSSFDRMLGYGLKERKGFRFTHLGKIGK